MHNNIYIITQQKTLQSQQCCHLLCGQHPHLLMYRNNTITPAVEIKLVAYHAIGKSVNFCKQNLPPKQVKFTAG